MEVAAAWGSLSARRRFRSLAGEPILAVQGETADPFTEWSGVVHVTRPLSIHGGRTLRILPGTLVLVEGVQTAEGQPGACESPSTTPGGCGVSITVRHLRSASSATSSRGKGS